MSRCSPGLPVLEIQLPPEFFFFFFLNEPAPTEISPLPLHAALPIAAGEANKLNIPVVAIVDTNADPDLITVPIPGNEDAIRAVSLIAAAIWDVIGEARRQM